MDLEISVEALEKEAEELLVRGILLHGTLLLWEAEVLETKEVLAEEEVDGVAAWDLIWAVEWADLWEA